MRDRGVAGEHLSRETHGVLVVVREVVLKPELLLEVHAKRVERKRLFPLTDRSCHIASGP